MNAKLSFSTPPNVDEFSPCFGISSLVKQSCHWDNAYNAVQLFFSSLLPLFLLNFIVPTLRFASATPVTTAYELRLVDGVTLLDGRLELKPMPTEPWGTICSNVFKENNNGANAACRSLGFANTALSYFVSFGSGNQSSPIWLDGVTCLVTARYLQNCTSKDLGDHSCVHGDDSGVRCVPSLSDWEFMLVNSTIPTRGLVLFRPSRLLPWGTIMREQFVPQTDVALHMRRAVCRSLGFAKAIFPIVAPINRFGTAPAKAPSYLRNPINSCGGHILPGTYYPQPVHPFLQNCSSAGYFQEHSWGTADQLQMYCDDSEIHDRYLVRFVHGYSNYSGQIQFRNDTGSPWLFFTYGAFLNGIPNNIINVTAHHTNALNAVCRTAGFKDVTNASFRFYNVNPIGGSDVQRPAQVLNITCPGGSQGATATLADCNMTRTHYTMNLEIPAGVDCYPDRLPHLPWEVRLFNTSVLGKASMGIAQMRFKTGEPDAPWGFISVNETNNFGLWDAFCNALGYHNTSTRITRSLTKWNGNDASWFRAGSTAFSPALLSNVSCPPRRYSVLDLTTSSNGSDPSTNSAYSFADLDLRQGCAYAPLTSSLSSASMALVIDCDTGANVHDPRHWQVRLNSSNALIEFRPDSRLHVSAPNSRWGMVCTTDPHALRMLCRAAGYATEYAQYVQRSPLPMVDGYDNAPSYLHGLTCPPSAQSLADCTFSHFEGEVCKLGEVASADCLAIPNDRSLWRFRLGGSNAALEPSVGLGRLEVQLAPWGGWGTVCDDGWGFYNTQAACRSLGFETIGNAIVPRVISPSIFSTSSAQIYLDDMSCGGLPISYLQNCTAYTFLNHNCGHSEDITLECLPSPPPLPIADYEFRGVSPIPSEPYIIRMEMRINASSPWGTVIQTITPSMDLMKLVCKEGGFTDSPVVERFSGGYGVITNAIMGNFACPTGSTSFKNCTPDPQTYRYFSFSQSDLVVNCRPIYNDPARWQLRLAGGPDAFNGRLEIKPLPYLEWGTVCDDSFTSYAQTAIAACMSVGYNYSDAIIKAPPGRVVIPPRMVDIGLFGYGVGTIWLDDMSCSNNPTYLQNCSSYLFNRHNCGHGEDVALMCNQSYNPDEFEFRFIPHPENPLAGRVEMRPDNQSAWGSIFQVSRVASVSRAACLGAGFLDPKPSFAPSVFPASNGVPVYVYDFVCGANATSLRDCTFASSLYKTQTSHSYDLTIECDYVDPNDRRFWEFRLDNGSHVKQHFGRVMFRPAPWTMWGTISGTSISADAASSICRSLGYTAENGYRDPLSAQTTTGLEPSLASGRIWMGGVTCGNRPQYLQNCSTLSWRPSASHTTDLWLDCYPQIQARIVGGPAPWRGRIEVKYNNWTSNGWGTLCNDEFVSNHRSWLAACRTAGFTNVTNAKYEEFGPGTGTINLDDVDCAEGEQFISDCAFSRAGTHNCDHAEDAGVNCYAPLDDHGVWQFRFAGNTHTPTSGRLEVLPSVADGIWGMICPLNFNHSYHAWMVACRTLGVQTTRAIPTRRFGAGYGPIFLDNVNCSANATILNECDTYPLGSYDCVPSEAMGLDCDPPPENKTAWEFRIDDTTIGRRNGLNIAGTTVINGKETPTAGTLLVRFSPSEPWGTVCNNNKELLNNPRAAAEIICRSLGLFDGVHRPQLHKSSVNTMRAPEWYATVLSNMSCDVRTPSTARLVGCTFNPMYDHSCDHSMDVHVDCRPRFPQTRTAEMTASLSAEPTPSAEIPRTQTIIFRSLTESATGDGSRSASAMLAATQSPSASLLSPSRNTAEMTESKNMSVTPDVFGTDTGSNPLSQTPSVGDTVSPAPSQNSPTRRETSDTVPQTPSPIDPKKATQTNSHNMSSSKSLSRQGTNVSDASPSIHHSPSTSEGELPGPAHRTSDTVQAPVITTSSKTASLSVPVAHDAQCTVSFDFAVTLSPAKANDVDINQNGLVINILLPVNATDPPTGVAEPSPLQFAAPQLRGHTTIRGLPSVVPHPLIRLYDVNVGTNEPQGYTQTFGLDGQSPSQTYGGGWWRDELEEPNANSTANASHPPRDRRLGEKYDGRFFCEVVGTKAVRCAVPQSGAYRLFAEDRLVLDISPAFVRDWIWAPSCGRNTRGEPAQPPSPRPAAVAKRRMLGMAAENATETPLADNSANALLPSHGNTARNDGTVRYAFIIQAAEPSEFAAVVDALGPIAGSVAVVAALLGGTSAMDVQLMSLLSQSACMGEVDRKSTSMLRYFTSPFDDAGMAAVTFGNLGIVVAFSLIQHRLAKHLETSRRIRQIDSWAAIRFPSFSFAAAQLFFVGVCLGTFSMLGGGPATPGGDDGIAASYAIGVVGLIACGGIVWAVAYTSTTIVTGKFVQYTQFLSRPWHTRWLYPLGFWEAPQSLAFGYMLTPYRDGDRIKLFSTSTFVSALVTAAIMQISAIPCEVRFGLVGVVFLTIAVMNMAIRPARQPANTVFSAAGQFAMALFAFTSAAQLVSPTVAMMNTKLALLFIQILIVVCRSCFSIVIRILENVRWKKFRTQQTDEFASDRGLINQPALLMGFDGESDFEDFELDTVEKKSAPQVLPKSIREETLSLGSDESENGNESTASLESSLSSRASNNLSTPITRSESEDTSDIQSDQSDSSLLSDFADL